MCISFSMILKFLEKIMHITLLLLLMLEENMVVTALGMRISALF